MEEKMGVNGKGGAEPWFTPKPATVFPKKKKLVKTMVFQYLTRNFSVFRPRPSPTVFLRRPPPPAAGDIVNGCLLTVSLKGELQKSKKIHPF